MAVGVVHGMGWGNIPSLDCCYERPDTHGFFIVLPIIFDLVSIVATALDTQTVSISPVLLTRHYQSIALQAARTLQAFPRRKDPSVKTAADRPSQRRTISKRLLFCLQGAK